MCGIVGMLKTGLGCEQWESILKEMSSSLFHRGPDDAGAWYDSAAGVGLGHRRLSILDLSPQGHQPMSSKGGRYVITFNGEIYNFQELRKELTDLGHNFAGYSDTEVMLAAFVQWGLKKALKRFTGMFAFALWDKKEHLLHLVRDRLGIKPLFYGWVNKSFVFGSELKAFKAHPEFKGEINRNALTLLLRHNYIPAPHSIYENVYKLLPGTILTINPEDKTAGLPRPSPYWSAKEIAQSGVANPFSGSESEAISCLDYLLREAVKMHMVVDAPG